MLFTAGVCVILLLYFFRLVTAPDARKRMPESHSGDDERSKRQKILPEVAGVSESEQLICCNVAVLICCVMQVTNACWPNYTNPSRNFQTILRTTQIQVKPSRCLFLLRMWSHCISTCPGMAYFHTLGEKSSPLFGRRGLRSRPTPDIAKQSMFMGPEATASPISSRLWLVSSSEKRSQSFTFLIVARCFENR